MSTTTAARPRQTTMAGAMVMLGASFVVLYAWDRVSRLRSIESREWLESRFADAPLDRLGLSVESMIQVVHVVALVAALCAVVAVALGWQVLQRSRPARVVLSVVAVPLFVTGLVTGGFMASLVAVATAMLWLSPSREWFAGLPLPEPAKPDQARRDANVQALSGRASEQPSPAVEAPASPTGWSVGAAAPTKRPGPVTVALVLTVAVAGVVLVTTFVSLVGLAAQPDLVLEEMRRQNPDIETSGVSETMLLATFYFVGLLVVAWSALAIVLAVLTAGRRAWAARGLQICAATCAFFCMLATLAAPVPLLALVPAVAAIATISSLRRPDVRAWLNAPR